MPLEYVQKSFLGGLTQQIDATRLGDNQYMLLINGRNRADTIVAIKQPLDLRQQIPSVQNAIQGVYGFGNFVVIFIDGRAYYKDYKNMPEEAGYVYIPGLLLNPLAPTVWAEAVPASTMNLVRYIDNSMDGNNVKLGDGAVNASRVDSKNNIFLVQPESSHFNVTPSPAGVICQDGTSQPFVITTQFGARRLGTYSQWTWFGNQREYVPVGKQMCYSNGILYIVSPDGKSILRSVTGRPFDFVVNLSTASNGGVDKGGTADTVSYSVDFDELTAIKRIDSNNFSFLASTRRTCYLVTPDFTNLIFNEPTFNNNVLFSAGLRNQECLIDINGDKAFITATSIKSFNAAQQTSIESNNRPFSAEINPLLSPVQQTTPCTADFDDYAMFAVNTIYGPGIVIYDKNNKTYTGLDLFDGVAQIKQFAIVSTDVTRKLLFITTDNKFYEYDAGPVTATNRLYIGEWCSQDPNIEQKASSINLVFTDAEETGIVTATLYVDRQLIDTQQKKLYRKITSLTYPLTTIPFGPATSDRVQAVDFDFRYTAKVGWKIGCLIEWDCKATLSHVAVDSDDVENIGGATKIQGFTYAQAGGK